MESLSNEPLTPRVGKLVAPCLANKDAAIRALAVDLLVRQNSAGFRDVLAAFAEKDSDPLVRQIASCAKPAK